MYRHLLTRCVALLIAVSAHTLAVAQPNKLPPNGTECLQWEDDSNAAARAEDWSAVESIELKRLQRCALGAVPRAAALESLTEALYEQKKFSAARQSARECISLSYRTVGCHIWLVAVFGALGDKENGSAQLKVADKVLEGEIDRGTKELRRAEEINQKATTADGRSEAMFGLSMARSNLERLLSQKKMLTNFRTQYLLFY